MVARYSLYNGRVVLEFDEKKHVYTVNGEKLLSVTGITDIINKPALMYWAVNCTLEHIEEHLKPGVALDEIQIKGLLADAKTANRRVRDKAADIGTLVHAYAEAYIKAELGMGSHPESPINEAIRNGVDAFTQWWDQFHVVPVASEEKVYSEQFGYAGTLDLDAEVDGKRCIVDFKTSSGIYPEMWLQTAGYQLAREEELDMRYDGRWIIQFSKTSGQFKAESRMSRREYFADRDGFLGALSLKKRLEEMK